MLRKRQDLPSPPSIPTHTHVLLPSPDSYTEAAATSESSQIEPFCFGPPNSPGVETARQTWQCRQTTTFQGLVPSPYAMLL